MVQLDKAWACCECEVHCMQQAMAGHTMSIASTIDNGNRLQKHKAVVDTASTNHEWSMFRWGTELCFICLKCNLCCTWKNWASGRKYTQCNTCHNNTLRKKCWCIMPGLSFIETERVYRMPREAGCAQDADVPPQYDGDHEMLYSNAVVLFESSPDHPWARETYVWWIKYM